ncbi:MAG: HAD family hydrolase [Rikenellaceae bacterium]
MNKAVLLDRDGTINVDHGYMHDPALLEFLPGAVEALKMLADEGYILIIITNQSGIGRGYFTEDQYNTFNDVVVTQLKGEGIEIADTFMCPHSPDDLCSCRKPYPYMAQRAIERYDIDVATSYMFGDKPSDVACGQAAGLTARLISGEEDLLYWSKEVINNRL